jgi:hypothetical protein
MCVLGALRLLVVGRFLFVVVVEAIFLIFVIDLAEHLLVVFLQALLSLGVDLINASVKELEDEGEEKQSPQCHTGDAGVKPVQVAARKQSVEVHEGQVQGHAPDREQKRPEKRFEKVVHDIPPAHIYLANCLSPNHLNDG